MFAAVTYSQTNVLAELANKSILDALRKLLDEVKGFWLEELPGLLWCCNTTLRESIGELPFHIAYSIAAITPVEIGMKSFCI